MSSTLLRRGSSQKSRKLSHRRCVWGMTECAWGWSRGLEEVDMSLSRGLGGAGALKRSERPNRDCRLCMLGSGETLGVCWVCLLVSRRRVRQLFICFPQHCVIFIYLKIQIKQQRCSKDNSYHLLNGPGTILSTMCAWTHRAITTPQWGRNCYGGSHFVEKKTEVQRLSKLFKTTELASGRVRIKTWAGWLRTFYSTASLCKRKWNRKR